MEKRAVCAVLGLLLLISAGFMCLPLLVGIFSEGEFGRESVALLSGLLLAAGSGAIRMDSELLAYHLDILASQAHVANHSIPFAVNMGGVLFGEDNADFAL